MPEYRNILTGDVVTVEGPNADYLDEHPDWKPVKAEKPLVKDAPKS